MTAFHDDPKFSRWLAEPFNGDELNVSSTLDSAHYHALRLWRFNQKRAELNEKIAAAYRQRNAIETAKERQEIVGKAVAAIGCAESKGRAAAALCN